MKKFLLTQQFDAPSHAVHEAFCTEATWQSFEDLPFVGNPVVQSFAAGDPTVIETAYHVAIELPVLAAQFIDADRMSFVEITHLAADGSGTFDIVPDHYGRLLTASGRIEMVPFDDTRCERLIQGSIDLNLGWSGKLFESPVEEAIVTGFKQALAAQAEQVVHSLT